MTEKIYYSDGYVKEFSAVVVDCIEGKDCFYIELDKTAFYPEGGGQPGDIGFINDIEIFDTHEKDDRVLHYSKQKIEKGTKVNCSINWERRFDFMQQHTGEHIVSGVIHSIFGFNNVGFHMNNDSVVIDIDGSLSDSDLEKVEDVSNNAVFDNIIVKCEFFDKNTLENIEYRSKKKIEGDIRIVNIENYDICACCGVHTKTTGEIGIIKIISSQNYKGGTRITMLCGKRALLDYRKKNRDIYKMSEMFSAKVENVSLYAENTLKNLENEKSINFGLYIDILKNRASNFDNNKFIIDFCDIENSDLIRRYCTMLSEKCSMCCVFSGDDKKGYKYVVYGKDIDMKIFAKEMNTALCGKGGGKNPMIQGSVSEKRENIENFFEKYK